MNALDRILSCGHKITISAPRAKATWHWCKKCNKLREQK